MPPRLEGLFASPQHYEKYKARLGKKLAEFRFGFMSDAKWRKLFSAICAEGSPAQQCEIYDFFGSCVNEIRFALPAADYAQGIRDSYISQRLATSEKPTLYAEIEYIEFAEFYDFASRGALLPPEHKSQDLDAIARYLERLGKFEMESGEQSLKIYGYRR